jgi:succinyl-diaminopimelate desuccinylase
LPNYDIDEIISNIKEFAKEYEKETGASIKFEPLSISPAPKPTDANAKVVTNLKEAIRTLRGIEPKVGGIGGGTCAAFFRKINVPAVVWSTIDETAHQPNEYSKIKNMVDDAKVFALMALM